MAAEEVTESEADVDEDGLPIQRYEAMGVDHFCYNNAYGLPLAAQKSSLKLFIDEVMPAFQGARAAAQ